MMREILTSIFLQNLTKPISKTLHLKEKKSMQIKHALLTRDDFTLADEGLA